LKNIPQSAILAAAWCVGTVWCGAALAQGQSNLPPGDYIYLGSQPGRLQPKAFTINSQGSVLWTDGNKQLVGPSQNVAGGRPQSAATAEEQIVGQSNSGKFHLQAAEKSFLQEPPDTQTLKSGNPQTDDYPVINWKVQKVTLSSPTVFISDKKAQVGGGTAQLTTTFVPKSGTTGTIKYTLKLFQVPPVLFNSIIMPVAICIQFLDNKGFAIEGAKLTISFRNVQQISGRALMEAKGEQDCAPMDYKQASDYAVSLLF
jgi:hypothetical protein